MIQGCMYLTIAWNHNIFKSLGWSLNCRFYNFDTLKSEILVSIKSNILLKYFETIEQQYTKFYDTTVFVWRIAQFQVFILFHCSFRLSTIWWIFLSITQNMCWNSQAYDDYSSNYYYYHYHIEHTKIWSTRKNYCTNLFAC